MAIVKHRRLDKPLPHVNYALQPVDFAPLQEGFMFMCGFDYYKKGVSCEPHFHDCDEYWFILDGKAKVRSGDAEAEVGHGDVVFTPMGNRHQFTALTNDVCMIWVYEHLKGDERIGHVHDDDENVWQRGDRESLIIKAERRENPLPHLICAMSPQPSDAVQAGFLSMCGIDYYKKGSECDYHFHDSEEYWLIVDGKAEVICGDETGIVEKGDVVFTPPNVDHQFKAVEDVGVLWLHGALTEGAREGHLHRGEDD